MKTDYFRHDERYRQLRARGATGWDGPEDVAQHIEELDWFANVDGVPRSGRALEIGCGAGDMTLVLAERGWRACGVDISPTAVGWAREKASARDLDASFAVGDVLTLDRYEHGAFDVVLDGHCLHCIIGVDRARVLAAVRRVLGPDGCFWIGTMCGAVEIPEVLENFDLETRILFRKGVASRYIGMPGDIIDEVRAAGFTVVAQRIVAAQSELDLDMLLVVAKR